MTKDFHAQVLLSHNSEIIIAFGKGRLLYHVVEVSGSGVRLATLDTLRGLKPAIYKGEPYPPKRAASFYLNHTTREVTKRARAVLRGLVARKPKGAA